MRIKALVGVVKDTFTHWWNDNTFELGAALAFYTLFSIAPVVVITVAIAGAAFGKEAALREFTGEVEGVAGPQVAGAIGDIARRARDGGAGVVATLVSAGALLIGATTVFAQLQEALNNVWGVKARSGQPLLVLLKDRFWSFTVVLGIGFLLLVSLVLSAALAALGNWLAADALPGGLVLWTVLNAAVSFLMIAVLFALMYKILPDVTLAWGDVCIGAAVTALLFTGGKYLIGLYLGRSTWISVYGAAGSLVVVLLWVYYSSQIVLLGAEFTRAYANRTGKGVAPTENATAVTKEARKREERAEEQPQARAG